jgi:predicted nucleic acid-binding protein
MGKRKSTVYIETSIVSYLTARPSSDLLAAAWQKATTDWWETQRNRFELYISDIVIEEAGKGDPRASEKRLNALFGIQILSITDEIVVLSEKIINEGVLPKKAIDDSLHISIATIHEIDYFLTWNCRHIANAEIKPLIQNICLRNNQKCPEICTPLELMGVNENG